MSLISAVFALLLAAGVSPVTNDMPGSSNLPAHLLSTCMQERENLSRLDPSIMLSNFGQSFISADEAKEIGSIIAKRESSPFFRPNSNMSVESVGLCWVVTFKNALTPDIRRGIPDHWMITLRKANGEIVAVG